jgi:hypothetical protein
MTAEKDTASRSRGALRPGFAIRSALVRAWGMPGARRTRSLACEVEEAHEQVSPQVRRNTRHSRTATGFNGSSVLSPGYRAC